MPLNDQYKTIKFKQSIRELLREYYSAKDDKSEHTKKLKLKIEGFFEARLLVDTATKEDVQLIVDEEHIAAFAMSRKERRTMKKLTPNPITKDKSSFDGPGLNSYRVMVRCGHTQIQLTWLRNIF